MLGNPACTSNLDISVRNVLIVSFSLYFIIYWMDILEQVKSKHFCVTLTLHIQCLLVIPTPELMTVRFPLIGPVNML